MTEELAKKRLELWFKCRNCPEDKQCYDKHLHILCEDYTFIENTPLEESIKVAIKVLSENKGDLISREELIKNLKSVTEWNGEIHRYIDEQGINSIPSVENKGEWIPVSERLPELDGEYLITYLTQGVYSEEDILVVCISDYDHDNGFWKSRKGKVIAWQPLPKPYEEGGE